MDKSINFRVIGRLRYRRIGIISQPGKSPGPIEDIGDSYGAERTYSMRTLGATLKSSSGDRGSNDDILATNCHLQIASFLGSNRYLQPVKLRCHSNLAGKTRGACTMPRAFEKVALFHARGSDLCEPALRDQHVACPAGAAATTDGKHLIEARVTNDLHHREPILCLELAFPTRARPHQQLQRQMPAPFAIHRPADASRGQRFPSLSDWQDAGASAPMPDLRESAPASST